MAVIRRVLGLGRRGVIVVLLAVLAGFVVPASAVADETPTPTASASATESATPSATQVATAEATESAPTPSQAQAGEQPTEPAPTADTAAAAPSGPSVAEADPVPTASGTAAGPAFTLTLTCDQPDGALVWADDELGCELVGANRGDTRLADVAISDDLAGVLSAATLAADPLATIIHGNGTAEPTLVSLEGTTLTWSGALEAGDKVVLDYLVIVGLVEEPTTLHNVAAARWTGADGSPAVVETAEVSNPINPVAIDDAHSGSHAGAGRTLAHTGVAGSATLLAFAALSLLFGIALVAVRRRHPPEDRFPE